MVKRSVFIVTDGTSITAEILGHSLLSQFPDITFHTTALPFVDSDDKAVDAVRQINQAAVTDEAKPIVLEQPIKPSRRGGWDAVTLDGDAFKAIGKIIAWRVRLLDGDIELAERRSFLWIESKPAGDAGKPAAD